MVRAFESVFRKVQNGAYQRLHAHVAGGALRGFVLAYLGQQDDRLPYRPMDLVPRSAVARYPTDFAPMSEEVISTLTARGETLTRLLVERYCPESSRPSLSNCNRARFGSVIGLFPPTHSFSG